MKKYEHINRYKYLHETLYREVTCATALISPFEDDNSTC
jgi:hypothetical protein